MRIFTSSGSSDEPQVVEFGHVILHDGRSIAEFGAPVLIVSGADRHQSAVVDSAETDDPEGGRKRLVGTPMRR